MMECDNNLQIVKDLANSIIGFIDDEIKDILNSKLQYNFCIYFLSFNYTTVFCLYVWNKYSILFLYVLK